MITSLKQLLRRVFSGADDLSPNERLVREKFAYALQGRFKENRALYKRRFGNVLNTDQAKELCREYSENDVDKILFSRAAYPPAKEFIKRLFFLEIELPDISTVTFLGGGAASGKSTAVETWKKNGRFPDNWLIMDGTLSEENDALEQIEAALKRQKQILVIYVYCPVAKAVGFALSRAMKNGRGITIQRLAKTHFYSQKSVLALSEQYTGFPETIGFPVFDNSGDKPVESNLLSIKEREYKALDQVTAAAQSAYKNECARREEEGWPVPEHIKGFFEKAG